MNVWFWVFIVYIVLNFVALVSMLFFERKTLSSLISWLTVLTFLPILGYVIYVVFGSGLSIRVKRMISRHAMYEVEFDNAIKEYLKSQPEELKALESVEGVVKCCNSYGSVLCPRNDVKFFCSGKEKLSALLEDLENAKQSINIEYYIFADDSTGKAVMDVLIRKAKEGVKVRLIYDSVGCHRNSRRFFRKLKKAGGEVAEFFPPFAHIRLINLKLNYRNHKKIVIIDGKIAYTGGINLRDDHMGKKKRVSPWRDTHVRITGTGVFPLQNAFLNDFRYLKKEDLSTAEYIEQGLFAVPTELGTTSLQVVLSGPNSPIQNIKEVFIKMILNAKDSVLIQTPYFIPDDAFMTALRVALASGVKVRIMVPSKPDYRTVYWVTLSYLKEIVPLGAEVLMYDGFVHAKVIVVDDLIVSVGTCNIDNRSFSLNFEDTVVMYSADLNKQYREIFEEDVKHCLVADETYFSKRKILSSFVQALCRLFSPVL